MGHGFHAVLQTAGCHVSCKDIARPRGLTGRSLLLHGKSFMGKPKGSVVSSSIANDQWSWALHVVGSKGQLCRPWFSLLVTPTAYASWPLAHCRLMISSLLSEFCSFPQASVLCSQISGVFLHYVRILFKCLYSPKPKLSNYPRKKASLNMPIKMNLSYRRIYPKYDGYTYPWVE